MSELQPVREPYATRAAFRDAVIAAMTEDERVVLVDTDTGLFGGVDFGPAADRYVNVGIAEQHAMSMAAALALDGWTAFVTTFAAFAAARALEAVKVDIAYNRARVRIAATHGGLSAGHLGPTHHALADIAAMRTLPNMTVTVPADADAVTEVVRQSADLPGPLYLRLGRKATPPVPAAEPLRIGRIQRLRDGGDVVIVACGPHPVLAALEAADDLAGAGIRAGVLNAHTVAPFDTAALVEAVESAALVVTVEEHRCSGGLGGVVAETLGRSAPRPLLTVGVPEVFVDTSGGHEHLLNRCGISGPAIASQVKDAMNGRDDAVTTRRRDDGRVVSGV